MSRQVLAGATVAGLMLVGSVLPSLRTAPDFHVPFPCGQTWSGATRTNHNPPQAIDFNRPRDLDDDVVASAHGVVALADDGGATNYGQYVVIDHGHGWETLYAHLSSIAVAEGDQVRAGQLLGAVGSTGTSTGAHLHYEQRLDGHPLRIVFDGRETRGQDTRDYASAPCR